MRKLFCCTSLLALTLALGACKEPDPNDFQTHITAMEDQGRVRPRSLRSRRW